MDKHPQLSKLVQNVLHSALEDQRDSSLHAAGMDRRMVRGCSWQLQ
jgi:hypothetical protein